MILQRILSTTCLVLLLLRVSTQVNGAFIKQIPRAIKKNVHPLKNPVHTFQNVATNNNVGPLPSTISIPAPESGRRKNPYEAYLNWIDRDPLVAKSVTAAIVGWVGDLMSQRLEAHLANVAFAVNWTRSGAFLISGLMFVGPFLQNWYEVLWGVGRFIEKNVTKNKQLQTLGTVLVDQTVGVMLYFPIYFYAYELANALVALRAPSWSVATNKLLANLGPVFFTQYKIWPLVNFLSFTFVPVRLRVLFNNVISVFWNCYLCARLA